MRGMHIVLKSLSDTLEHLLPFTLASLGWWLGIVSILFGPGTTQALFRLTDPRITSELERPGIRPGFSNPFKLEGRVWGVAALTVVPAAVLLANLSWSSKSTNIWTLMIPLWLILLVSFSVIGLMSLSTVSLFKNSGRESIRIAAVLAYGRPGYTIPFLIALAPVIVICVGLIVPAFLFLPALIAAAVNRLVLDGLGIPIHDPLAPSDERRIEESKAQTRRKFGP
jgi:uncharacterized membrane protein YesL